MLNAAGVTVVAALISPYRDDRAMARSIIGDAAFFDVYLETSLQVCEQRDPKGLYRQARSGLIQKFTGISDPYEPPPHPYLQFDTHSLSVADCLTLMQGLLTQ